MFRKIRAFTLVELMVVIVIIGILAALAIPRLTGMTAKARLAEFKPQLKTIFILQETYLEERGVYAPVSGFLNNNAAIGFIHPATGNFTYSILSPAVISSMLNQELSVVRMASGMSIRLSDLSILNSSDGLIACVDGEGIQYATSSQIVRDAGLRTDVNTCQ